MASSISLGRRCSNRTSFSVAAVSPFSIEADVKALLAVARKTRSPLHIVAHSYGDVYFRNALQHDSKSRIDCGITIENCKWNDDGKILAVCGVLNETDPNEPHASVVNFYSRDGILLYSLKVPTTERIFDLLWDPSGKLLVAFENSVFFASVHTPSTFTAVGNTMAYIS